LVSSTNSCCVYVECLYLFVVRKRLPGLVTQICIFFCDKYVKNYDQSCIS
jgi:hypothetical protein